MWFTLPMDMEETVEFNPAYTLLTYTLAPGESVNVEPGAMVAMGGVEMQTRKSGGGFFKSLKKMALGGESFFLNTFTAGGSGGWVSVAPGSPGDIQGFDLVPGQALFIQGGSYLASTLNVVTDTKFQGMKGFFSGESMFFVQASTEDGTVGRVWYNSFGAIKQIPVQPGQTITVRHWPRGRIRRRRSIHRQQGWRHEVVPCRRRRSCDELHRSRQRLDPNSKRRQPRCQARSVLAKPWQLSEPNASSLSPRK